EQRDAVAGVGGDDVAGPGPAAADRVVGAVGDYPVPAVAEGRRRGEVRPDRVALDHVAAGDQVHAGAAVARDDVAGPRGGAADGVAVGEDDDAVASVAQGRRPGGVGADEVARHHVGGAVQVDAVVGVAGNQVAGPGRGAADRVAGREDD